MRLRTIILGFIVFLVFAAMLGAGWRALQILPYPIGIGEERASPDGRYTAFVTSWEDRTFFGGTRNWFEFGIHGGSSPRLVTDPIPGPYFGSRSGHRVISWAQDSSSASFTFPGIEISMQP